MGLAKRLDDYETDTRSDITVHDRNRAVVLFHNGFHDIQAKTGRPRRNHIAAGILIVLVEYMRTLCFSHVRTTAPYAYHGILVVAAQADTRRTALGHMLEHERQKVEDNLVEVLAVYPERQ